MSVSLNEIVSVNVYANDPSTVSSNFNLGLIIGDSGKLTAGKQLVIYSQKTWKTAMTSDGFANTDPEYKAVEAYFGQSEISSEVAVADILNDSVDAAVTKLRNLNDKWYNFCFALTDPDTKLTDENINKIAAAVDTFAVPTIFYFSSNDANCIAPNQENIFSKLKAKGYKRTFGYYDSSADRLICPAVVGLVSAFNSMKSNSAYTLAYKTLNGVTANDLNDTQIAALVSYNGNAYTTFGATYSFTYPCISFGDYHPDEIYLVDAAKYLIQQRVVEGLTSKKIVPQTEDGVSQIIAFAARACNQLLDMGVIASGIWTGEPVKDLNTGDAIANGYVIQSDSISSQSAEDRLARKSPAIYVCLKGSGAIEHVVISVYVNR